MSKFIENNPSAIEVLIFYEREKKANGENLNEKLAKLIGKDDELTRLFDKMTMEDTEAKRKEIRQLVVNNQANLRLCILSDIIDKKPIIESVWNIAKIIGYFDMDYQDFEFWFGRFSSGNWNLDQKTFSDMSFEVLGNIMQKLDFLSQMKLRNVSRGLQNIVNKKPPPIDHISFKIDCESSQSILNLSIFKSKGTDSDRCWKRCYNGEDNWKKSFDGMKVLLSNPRLRLTTFTWNIISSEMNVQFIDVINSLNNKIKIENLDTTLDGDLLIDLLKAIEPGTLEGLDFIGKFEAVHFDRLAQMDQWKKARSVRYQFYLDISPDFHHFQHFQDVSINVESLTMDDILIVKKLFVQNDKLKAFYIDAGQKPSESEIVEALGLSNYFFGERSDYSLSSLELPGSNECLEVSISESGINIWRETE